MQILVVVANIMIQMRTLKAELGKGSMRFSHRAVGGRLGCGAVSPASLSESGADLGGSSKFMRTLKAEVEKRSM